MKKEIYIKRDLEDKILTLLKAPEILAVVGPRQSGKTTMINNILKDLEGAKSVSFDDQGILNMFEKNTEDFISIFVKGNKYLFIDEFQYAKNGGKVLKFIYDSFMSAREEQRVKIIISGSSILDLTVQAVKYLTGRILVLNLYPFNFREFLSVKDRDYLKLFENKKNEFTLGEPREIEILKEAHQKLLKYYEEYLIFGGYPRVALEENYEIKKDLLKNIYNTYFLREVRDILGLIDDYKLGNLMKGLALQIGNLIEYNEFSVISQFSYVSLKKYMNFLEKTYICKFVRPFFKNRRTEIVKNPKVYFLDTGLRNSIVNDFRGLDGRGDKGALLENGLAAQFIKQGIDFNFWRDKAKNEIDFILNLGENKTIAVESKSGIHDFKNHSIENFKKKYEGIDVYLSYANAGDETKKIKNSYPVYLF